jgi:hypothetical protein
MFEENFTEFAVHHIVCIHAISLNSKPKVIWQVQCSTAVKILIPVGCQATD